MAKQKKLTLSEALEKAGLAAEWEARGRREVIALMKQGYTAEQIERMERMEPPDGAPLPTNS